MATVNADPFDARERKAWDLIIETMGAIQDIDERGKLPVNQEELCEAVHTLQRFVTQHMNWRYWPEEFSDWWEQPDGQAGNE